MLRMKPAFLYQSEKSSGFSPVYALIPRTTLIRLLLVLLLVSVSILFRQSAHDDTRTML